MKREVKSRQPSNCSFYLLFLLLFSFPIFAASPESQPTYEQVKTLKKDKKYLEAIPLLEKLVPTQNTNLDWKVELCHLYRWTNQLLKSSKCFDTVLSQNPNYPDALMGKAYLAIAQKNQTEAKRLAIQLLQQNPNNQEAKSLLAEIETKNLTPETKPMTPTEEYEFVQQLKKQKKYLDASSHLENLLKNQPSNLDWKVELCHLYRWRKDYTKSLSCFDEVLVQKPDHPDAKLGKAYIARARGNLKMAKEIVITVLAQNPQNSDASQFLAELKKIEAKKAQAEKERQLAANNPSSDLQSAEYQQIQGLEKEKKYSEAIPLLQKMVLEKPENLDLKMELCNLFRWSEKYSEASDCYDQILTKKQNHPDAMMGKAYLANQKDNRIETRNWIEKVLVTNPKNNEAMLLLAKLEKRENNPEKSKALYEEVLKNDPNNEEAKTGGQQDLVRDPMTSVNRTHFNILNSTRRWRIDVGGVAMKFNFAPTAPGAFFQLYHTKPKKYFFLARFDYLNKFGENNYLYTVGGGYYVHPRLILSDTIATAGRSDVLVRLQNIFEISGIAPHGVNPYVRYNYSMYQLVKLHAITNGVAWYFNRWGILDVNYSNILTKTDVAAGWARDYSTVTRLTFIPIENRFKFYMAYVREQESFDAGNPVFPVGRFRSNHYGAGLEWVMIHNVGIRIDTDYEDRNNGQTVQTYSSSIFYQF